MNEHTDKDRNALASGEPREVVLNMQLVRTGKGAKFGSWNTLSHDFSTRPQ